MEGIPVGGIKIIDRLKFAFYHSPRIRGVQHLEYWIRLATSRKRTSLADAVEPVSLLAAVGKAVPALSPATIGQ